MPKFAILVSASAESEAGKMPTTEELSDMMAFNEQLSQAGVLLSGEGFLASSKGARKNFSPEGPSKPVYGPFGLENLIAGYWFWELDTMEQAIEWAGKIPFKEGHVEIRRIAGDNDFGTELTDELKSKMDEMRKKSGELVK